MTVMSAVIEISDIEWALVEDLFDPHRREGKPARYPRRDVVDAILFLARTGCQWRYLPTCYPPWEAVWQQVAALALERSLGEGHDSPGGADPHPTRTHRQADDGDDRRPDRSRRTCRAHVPRGWRTRGRSASRRSRRSTASSTSSRAGAGGGGCRAATRDSRRAPGPGSKWPPSPTYSDGSAWSRPERSGPARTTVRQSKARARQTASRLPRCGS